MVHQLEGCACPKAAGLGFRLEPSAPRGHERVLGRDEDRVPQNEQEDREYAEEVAHAPLSGAWVLGGSSSSKLARSIGNGTDVLVPLGPILEHEPLEVGERLGDREPA